LQRPSIPLAPTSGKVRHFRTHHSRISLSVFADGSGRIGNHGSRPKPGGSARFAQTDRTPSNLFATTKRTEQARRPCGPAITRSRAFDKLFSREIGDDRRSVSR